MRRLKPDPVPDELISKILQAGICAPNGGNVQKWRFMVLRTQDQAGRAGLVQEGVRRVDRPALPQQRAPPGTNKEKYLPAFRRGYLTDHFAEAPV